MQLFNELKRRNVFRVAIGYIVSSWLLIQVADIVLDNIGAPTWVMQTILLMLALGVPVVVFFSWAYEVTPEGIKRESEIERGESITHLTGRKLDHAIVAVLVIALGYFVYDKFVLSAAREAALIEATTQAVTEKAPVEPEVVANTEKSIAVLPFVNMSSDPEQEYFSDGLSEEILNLLAKIDGLKVIGRTSSFAFKGKNEDLRKIGKALDVTTVLEGSVRKSGDRVRVTAQLINVSDGSHLWSETYDRTLTDIFAVQDDVATSIIDALQIHISAAPTRGRPTESPEAYTFFLGARAALIRFDITDARIAAQKAVELDPMFAEAYELLALTYWSSGTTISSKEARKGVNDAAARALAIEPGLLFSRTLFDESAENGVVSWASTLEALKRGVHEEPNHIGLLTVLIWDLQIAGYFKESLLYSERLIELDPLSFLAHYYLRNARIANGLRIEALESLNTMEQLYGTDIGYAAVLFHLRDGQDELAIDYLERLLLADGSPTGLARELIVGARDPETGQAHLDVLIPQIVASSPDDRSAMQRQIDLTEFYSAFGFMDRYFELLFELGVDEGGWGDAEVPIYESTIDRQSGFTGHPRYLEIAEKWEFFELWDKHGPPDMCEKLDGQWVCK